MPLPGYGLAALFLLMPSIVFAHGYVGVTLMIFILPIIIVTAIFLPFSVISGIKKISSGSVTKKIFQGIIALTFSIILSFGVFMGIFFMLYSTMNNIIAFSFSLVGLLLIGILTTKMIDYISHISVQMALKIIK